jgi:lambda family phage minor tail protein L
MSRSSSNTNKQIASINPGVVIDLYEINFANLQESLQFLSDSFSININNEPVYRFCPMINGSNPIVWQGNSYQPLPIKMEGFEYQGEGRLPRPKLTIANPEGLFSKIIYSNHDFMNCKITRKRTFAKFLDNENFEISSRGVNDNNRNTFGSSDPNSHFPEDVYYINRKTSEDKKTIQFELVSALEMEQAWIPARPIIANHCSWTYRCSIGCRYKGLPIETLEGRNLTKDLKYASSANSNNSSINFGRVDPDKYTGKGQLMNAVPEWSKFGHKYENNEFIEGDEDSKYGYQLGDVVKIINNNSSNPYINVPQVFVCIQAHSDPAKNHPFISKSHWLKDECSKDIKACKKRFSNLKELDGYNSIAGTKNPASITHEETNLPFGGFPGAEPYPFD